MRDDIVRHLFLDESVITDFQERGLPCRELYSPSRWMRPALEFCADVTRTSLAQSTKRLLLCAAGVPLACGLAWFAWYWMSTGRFIESTDDAYVGGDVTTLSAKVAGFIDAVVVADNQSVRAGDLLLKLDARDYRAQLARAEASVAAQRAALANTDANRRMHEAMPPF
jgi:multidrug resistance efflux pump